MKGEGTELSGTGNYAARNLYNLLQIQKINQKLFIAKEIWKSPRRLSRGKVLNGNNIPLFPLRITPI